MTDKAPTTDPRTEHGHFGEWCYPCFVHGEAEATASVIQRVEALRALIGPLDPSCAKARAETLDAVLAILRGDSR